MKRLKANCGVVRTSISRKSPLAIGCILSAGCVGKKCILTSGSVKCSSRIVIKGVKSEGRVSDSFCRARY